MALFESQLQQSQSCSHISILTDPSASAAAENKRNREAITFHLPPPKSPPRSSVGHDGLHAWYLPRLQSTSLLSELVSVYPWLQSCGEVVATETSRRQLATGNSEYLEIGGDSIFSSPRRQTQSGSCTDLPLDQCVPKNRPRLMLDKFYLTRQKAGS